MWTCVRGQLAQYFWPASRSAAGRQEKAAGRTGGEMDSRETRFSDRGSPITHGVIPAKAGIQYSVSWRESPS